MSTNGNGKALREIVEYSRHNAAEFIKSNDVPPLEVALHGQVLARNIRDDYLLALWSRLRWRALKAFGYVHDHQLNAEIRAQITPWQTNWGKAADEVPGR